MPIPIGNLDVWVRCPAALADAPDDGMRRLLTDTARESMAARWASEALLAGDAQDWGDLTGRMARGGGEVTVEIAKAAEVFVKAVRAADGSLTVIENGPAGIGPLNVVQAPGPKLFVFNYSWVARTPASESLMVMAAAIAHEPGAGVEIRIFEPRARQREPWSRYLVTEDAMKAALRRVTDAQEAATAPQRPAYPGHHCSYCPHRLACQALADALAEEYQRPPTAGPGQQAPLPMMAEEAEHLRAMLSAGKARLEALEAEIVTRALHGHWFKGWQLKQGYGNRCMAVSAEEAAKTLGMKVTKEVPMSPAELERDGADASLLSLITTRPLGRISFERANPEGVFDGLNAAKIETSPARRTNRGGKSDDANRQGQERKTDR